LNWKAYVCLSISNTLAVIDLSSGVLSLQITVGVAPFDVVLSPDGATAYVSNLGGRFPMSGELVAESRSGQLHPRRSGHLSF
jgi:YVTN family beta-propeller protein